MWAGAQASAISFTGIDPVDPFRPARAHDRHAAPSQVALPFRGFLIVTAGAKLVVGVAPHWIAATRTVAAVAAALDYVHRHESTVVDEHAVDAEFSRRSLTPPLTHEARCSVALGHPGQPLRQLTEAVLAERQVSDD
jgi:hypothetical protein